LDLDVKWFWTHQLEGNGGQDEIVDDEIVNDDDDDEDEREREEIVDNDEHSRDFC
jgi:hypothetical protein